MYSKVASEIAQSVGGVDNIASAQLCSTRIRFDLKDTALVNEENLRKCSYCRGLLHCGVAGIQLLIGIQAGNILSALKSGMDLL